MKMRKTIVGILKYLILSAVLILAVFPIFYTIMGSFKTNMEIMTEPAKIFPASFTMDNYITAMQASEFNILSMLKNSIIYSGLTVLIMVAVASTSAYVFAKGNFPGKNQIFAVFVAMMFVVTGGVTIYATFEVYNFFHIPRNLWSLVALSIFTMPTANMYLVKGYIESLPHEIFEAAKIDGCGFMGSFWKIAFPLLKPIIATIIILGFQGSWNAYIMPTIFTVNNPEQATLMVGLMALKNAGSAATSWNLMLAGCVVAMIPVLVVYAFCNKYFVEGIAAGAVKG